jgi:hypothetical protein
MLSRMGTLISSHQQQAAGLQDTSLAASTAAAALAVARGTSGGPKQRSCLCDELCLLQAVVAACSVYDAAHDVPLDVLVPL